MGYIMIDKNEIPSDMFWKESEALTLYLHFKICAWNIKRTMRYKGKNFKLGIFELPYSIRDIIKETGYTKHKVTKLLKVLVSAAMIDKQTRNGVTIISILEPVNRQQTPSIPINTNGTGQKTIEDRTQITKSRTGVKIDPQSDSLRLTIMNQTQYKKEEVFKEAIPVAPLEKKISPVNDVMNHINSKLESIGNRAISFNPSVPSHWDMIEDLLSLYDSVMNLKMEISRFFNEYNRSNRFELNINIIYDHLVNLIESK